ncbi:MAG: rhomboid family intramembrane serine protease [Candidatus Pacebacteria bacterium]|nr:rhomboid family intramembrane serine protease [Candidatus Paceibacterota bacterium]
MFPLYDESRIKGKIPWVTMGLIILNTFFFLYSFFNLEYFINNFGFVPSHLFDGRFFTVFTSMFLHGNLFHLIGNMWFLWIFGGALEARLNSFKFLAFYFVCGIGGALVYSLAMADSSAVVIGASGAISGVLGGYLVLFPKNKIKALVPLIFFFTIISVPAVIYIFIWFLYQIFSLSSIETTVAYWGHIGGFITGMLMIKRFKRF